MALLYAFLQVVSAYLYHSQEFPPAEEGQWLYRTNFNPCAKYDFTTLLRYLQKIAHHIDSDPRSLYDRILLTEKFCRELVLSRLKPPSPRKLGYNALLRSFEDPLQGLYLEAARSLLSRSGGDLLRMASNALYETESAVGISKRVFLSDFPIGDIVKFRQSAATLFSFLMDYPAGGDSYAILAPSSTNTLRRRGTIDNGGGDGTGGGKSDLIQQASAVGNIVDAVPREGGESSLDLASDSDDVFYFPSEPMSTLRGVTTKSTRSTTTATAADRRDDGSRPRSRVLRTIRPYRIDPVASLQSPQPPQPQLLSMTSAAAGDAQPSDTPPDHPQQVYFWSCLTVEDAVERAVTAAFINSSTAEVDRHFTTGTTTATRQQRAVLISALKQHALLGPLLDAVDASIRKY